MRAQSTIVARYYQLSRFGSRARGPRRTTTGTDPQGPTHL